MKYLSERGFTWFAFGVGGTEAILPENVDSASHYCVFGSTQTQSFFHKKNKKHVEIRQLEIINWSIYYFQLPK